MDFIEYTDISIYMDIFYVGSFVCKLMLKNLLVGEGKRMSRNRDLKFLSFVCICRGISFVSLKGVLTFGCNFGADSLLPFRPDYYKTNKIRKTNQKQTSVT